MNKTEGTDEYQPTDIDIDCSCENMFSCLQRADAYVYIQKYQKDASDYSFAIERESMDRNVINNREILHIFVAIMKRMTMVSVELQNLPIAQRQKGILLSRSLSTI